MKKLKKRRIEQYERFLLLLSPYVILVDMLFDAHTHPQFVAYDEDRDAVISRAHEAGVFMIAVGTQQKTSEAAIALAKRYPHDVRATIGFHPTHAISPLDLVGKKSSWYHDPQEQRESALPEFNRHAFLKLANDPSVVAIGECGLDYYRLTTDNEKLIMETKELQKEVFIEQMKLAESVGKALMIHCRPSKGTNDAYEDLLSLITNYELLVTIPKIVHFYVGSPTITQKLLDAGFYFTLGGVITFARDYDESIKMISLDRILLETDAPYVAPEPYRGKKNEPAYIVETAKKLAEIKNVPYDIVREVTTQTARRVFGI